MRGRGITSGRRPIRPDGGYYRESRRRRLGGRGGVLRLRGRFNWAVLLGAVVVIAIIFWLLR